MTVDSFFSTALVASARHAVEQRRAFRFEFRALRRLDRARGRPAGEIARLRRQAAYAHLAGEELRAVKATLRFLGRMQAEREATPLAVIYHP